MHVFRWCKLRAVAARAASCTLNHRQGIESIHARGGTYYPPVYTAEPTGGTRAAGRGPLRCVTAELVKAVHRVKQADTLSFV